MSTVFGGMAASLDGYIASDNGDLSWLNDAMANDEDYGHGPNVCGHPPSKARYQGQDGTLRRGSARIGVRIKGTIPEDKDICLFGGGALVTEFVELGLIDELGISVIPVILGGGVPFFGRVSKWTQLELMECRHYSSGIVLLNYRLKGPGTQVLGDA